MTKEVGRVATTKITDFLFSQFHDSISDSVLNGSFKETTKTSSSPKYSEPKYSEFRKFYMKQRHKLSQVYLVHHTRIQEPGS